MFQLMLSQHPDIATTSEPWIALHPFFALKPEINTQYDARVARQALKEFLRQSGVDEVFYKKQVKKFLTAFYVQATGHQKKRFFLDKTPRYYFIIDDLLELFPKAKFIFLFRHPLAVLNSILKTWVKDDLTKLSLFRDDLLSAPHVLLAAREKYPNRIHTVSYENLVINPVSIINKVCDFLIIQYSENMATYCGKLPAWKLGDPIGIHKFSCPSTESLQSWKNGLSSPQYKLLAHSYINELGKKVLEDMGYDFNEAVATTIPLNKNNYDDLISWPNALKPWSNENKYHHILTENEALIAHQETIVNSLSWKIAKPVRVAVRLLKKIMSS